MTRKKALILGAVAAAIVITVIVNIRMSYEPSVKVEVTDLDFEGEEGVYTVRGYLHNLKAEPDSNIELQFDFYDDAGEVVTTEIATVVIPAVETQTEVVVSTESPALISGFTYSAVGSATPDTGS